MTRLFKLDDGHIKVLFRRAQSNVIGPNCCDGTMKFDVEKYRRDGYGDDDGGGLIPV